MRVQYAGDERGSPSSRATRDMSNTHLGVPRAMMLARVRDACMHSGAALARAGLCCPGIFYSGRHYVSIFSSAALCIDELLSSNKVQENGSVSAKCSPSLPLSIAHTHKRVRCKLHIIAAALHIHRGALCQRRGSIPHLTAGRQSFKYCST